VKHIGKKELLLITQERVSLIDKKSNGKSKGISKRTVIVSEIKGTSCAEGV
jgi:hypothetical protein